MNSKKISVGVSVIPPIIMKSKNGFSGFEIDLWERIAKDLNIEYSYKEYDFKELMLAAKNKEINIGMAGVTETEKREILIDFSHKTLDSSLAILISKKQTSLLKTIRDFLAENYKKMFFVMIVASAFIIGVSYVLWVLEGRSVYSNSFFESLYMIISAMTNSGFSSTIAVKSLWGKSVMLFSMIFGLFMFGCFTAILASFLTAIKIKYHIDSPKDLSGRKVATKEDSIAVEELEKLEANIVTVKNIDEAFEMLKRFEVDAVVYDTPSILNYMQCDEEKDLVIATKFLRQTYGFIFPSNSDFREVINREILKLRDIGDYDLIYRKWFGHQKY
jgi:polar amino acid transport system substrate-binding protein